MNPSSDPAGVDVAEAATDGAAAAASNDPVDAAEAAKDGAAAAAALVPTAALKALGNVCTPRLSTNARRT